MRSKRNHKPRWGMLSLILLLAIGGLALEHNLNLTPTGHKIALFLVIIVIYGLIGLWIQSNAPALQDLDDIEHRKQRRAPAAKGTPESPSFEQTHFQEVASLRRPESPEGREGFQ